MTEILLGQMVQVTDTGVVGKVFIVNAGGGFVSLIIANREGGQLFYARATDCKIVAEVAY